MLITSGYYLPEYISKSSLIKIASNLCQFWRYFKILKGKMISISFKVELLKS